MGIFDALRSRASLARKLDQVDRHLRLVETQFGAAFWHALDAAYETSLPHREIRCIVCDHVSGRDGYQTATDRCIFGGGKLERYCCPTCDCIFGPMKYLDLDEAFVGVDYQLLYARYSEGDTSDYEIKAFHSLAPAKDGHYVDWGCGVEHQALLRIRSSGFDHVVGFEPSIERSTDAVVKSRDEIASGLDGIFSNNVIEHFRDPVAQFRAFHALLKDGSAMAHSTACYDYAYPFTRFHAVFLLGKSPHVLAERTGFRVSNVERDGEYINHVFRKV